MTKFELDWTKASMMFMEATKALCKVAAEPKVEEDFELKQLVEEARLRLREVTFYIVQAAEEE